jgi:hypothetical protein
LTAFPKLIYAHITVPYKQFPLEQQQVLPFLDSVVDWVTHKRTFNPGRMQLEIYIVWTDAENKKENQQLQVKMSHWTRDICALVVLPVWFTVSDEWKAKTLQLNQISMTFVQTNTEDIDEMTSK